MADINSSFIGHRYLVVGALILIALAASACGSEEDVEVAPRFLLGGWILPDGDDADVSPFAESLKVVVLTTENEIRTFLNGVDLIRPRGDPQTLFRTDLEQNLILAVYYLWRPLKGDPLSIRRAVLRDDVLRVSLELVDEPQGEEFPYLLAPLSIVALDNTGLPVNRPLNIVFLLNGEAVETLEISLE